MESNLQADTIAQGHAFWRQRLAKEASSPGDLRPQSSDPFRAELFSSSWRGRSRGSGLLTVHHNPPRPYGTPEPLASREPEKTQRRVEVKPPATPLVGRSGLAFGATPDKSGRSGKRVGFKTGRESDVWAWAYEAEAQRPARESLTGASSVPWMGSTPAPAAGCSTTAQRASSGFLSGRAPHKPQRRSPPPWTSAQLGAPDRSFRRRSEEQIQWELLTARAAFW